MTSVGFFSVLLHFFRIVMKKTTAFVFAAGLGTRLYPLTADRPKAMVLYKDKPLLQHVIEKIVAAGIDDIIVNVHHFPDQISDFVKTHRFGARVRISDERAYLRDTAGGLKFAEPLLEDAETLLLYNVDILSTINLNAMLKEHSDTGADVTLAVRSRKTSRYLVFDELTMSMCGWKNVATGEVVVPKEPEHAVDLAFSGIHVVNRNFVKAIPTVEKCSLTPLYVQLVNTINIKGYLHQNDDWIDVGKYEQFKNILK